MFDPLPRAQVAVPEAPVAAREESPLQELVSIKTLAQLLDVPEKTIRGWVWRRQIPFHRIGPKLIRFHLGEVRKWYGAQKVEVKRESIIREEFA